MTQILTDEEFLGVAERPPAPPAPKILTEDEFVNEPVSRPVSEPEPLLALPMLRETPEEAGKLALRTIAISLTHGGSLQDAEELAIQEFVQKGLWDPDIPDELKGRLIEYEGKRLAYLDRKYKKAMDEVARLRPHAEATGLLARSGKQLAAAVLVNPIMVLTKPVRRLAQVVEESKRGERDEMQTRQEAVEMERKRITGAPMTPFQLNLWINKYAVPEEKPYPWGATPAIRAEQERVRQSRLDPRTGLPLPQEPWPKLLDPGVEELYPKWVEVTPAETFAEKGIDAAASLIAFAAHIAVFKRLFPAYSATVHWELANLASGGEPGQGAVMQLALGGLAAGFPGMGARAIATRTILASTFFGGATYAGGGDTKDILISVGIPIVFEGFGVTAKQWATYRGEAKKVIIDALKEKAPALAARPDAEIDVAVGQILPVEPAPKAAQAPPTPEKAPGVAEARPLPAETVAEGVGPQAPAPRERGLEVKKGAPLPAEGIPGRPRPEELPFERPILSEPEAQKALSEASRAAREARKDAEAALNEYGLGRVEEDVAPLVSAMQRQADKIFYKPGVSERGTEIQQLIKDNPALKKFFTQNAAVGRPLDDVVEAVAREAGYDQRGPEALSIDDFLAQLAQQARALKAANGKFKLDTPEFLRRAADDLEGFDPGKAAELREKADAVDAAMADLEAARTPAVAPAAPAPAAGTAPADVTARYESVPGFVAIGPAAEKGMAPEQPGVIQQKLEQAIKNKPKDLGNVRDIAGSLYLTAHSQDNPTVIKAADALGDMPLQMSNNIMAHQQDAAHLFASLPKEYRAKKGAKFFELMDRTQTPAEIDTDPTIPPEVKAPLKQFKAWGEERRLELWRRNVERATATYEACNVETLADLAAKRGLPVQSASVLTEAREPGEGRLRLQSSETGETLTKAQVARQLAELDHPEADYGYKYGHILHTWFGQWNLTYLDAEGNSHFIDRAETKSEALLKLMAWNKSHPEIPVENLSAKPETVLPLDVTRVSRARYFALVGDLADAADLTAREVQGVLRGKVGTIAGRQKWMPQRLQRLGKEGYSQDFMRVWNLETMQFYRWKYLTDLNREVQPLIEALKAEGLPRWAAFLKDSMDYTWGTRSESAAAFDDFLARAPVIGYYVKPFALERWLGKVRGAQYLLKLQTGKFYALNSLQPVQTLWSLVGTFNFVRGILLYYSKEGQALLHQHNILAAGGKLAETRSFRAGRVSRYMPAGASEFRNQGIAFLTLYDMGRRAGLSDMEAAKYGRLRGQVATQFAYVPSNVPKYARGPVLGTVFQFKQFNTKQLELVGMMMHERNYTGVGRWLVAQALIGGIRVATSKALWVPGFGYLTYALYKKIKEEHGEEAADVLMFGLPALAGADMSGSMDPLNFVNTGRTVTETIGQTVLGPTGSDIVNLATTLGEEKTAGPVSLPAKARALAEHEPTLAQFDAAYRLLTTDTTRLDSKGRMVFEENYRTLIPELLGFKPIQKGREALWVDAAIALTYERDKVLDRAVNAYMGGDAKAVDEALNHWNLYFPEAPLSKRDVAGRIKERREAQRTPQAERRVKGTPRQVEKVVGEKP